MRPRVAALEHALQAAVPAVVRARPAWNSETAEFASTARLCADRER